MIRRTLVLCCETCRHRCPTWCGEWQVPRAVSVTVSSSLCIGINNVVGWLFRGTGTSLIYSVANPTMVPPKTVPWSADSSVVPHGGLP
eukprot:m.1631791 g.1631791  ORF g.1631791 m.1631791 type:complete len:88 (-) comp25403_c0_seq38:3263-3526(-)